MLYKTPKSVFVKFSPVVNENVLFMAHVYCHSLSASVGMWSGRPSLGFRYKSQV